MPSVGRGDRPGVLPVASNSGGRRVKRKLNTEPVLRTPLSVVVGLQIMLR